MFRQDDATSFFVKSPMTDVITFGVTRMKTPMFLKMAVVLAMAVGCVTLAIAKECDEENGDVLALSQVPTAVQKTIKANVDPSDIKFIMKDEDDDGDKPAYVVRTVKFDLTIDEEGKLMQKTVAMEWVDVPEAVRKTITEQASYEVNQVTEDGKITYVTTVRKGDAEYEITVAPDGKLIKSEEVDEEEEGSEADHY